MTAVDHLVELMLTAADPYVRVQAANAILELAGSCS